jgi:hypothetical protein
MIGMFGKFDISPYKTLEVIPDERKVEFLIQYNAWYEQNRAIKNLWHPGCEKHSPYFQAINKLETDTEKMFRSQHHRSTKVWSSNKKEEFPLLHYETRVCDEPSEDKWVNGIIKQRKKLLKQAHMEEAERATQQEEEKSRREEIQDQIDEDRAEREDAREQLENEQMEREARVKKANAMVRKMAKARKLKK